MMSERHGERERRGMMRGSCFLFSSLRYAEMENRLRSSAAVPGAHMYMGASSTT